MVDDKDGNGEGERPEQVDEEAAGGAGGPPADVIELKPRLDVRQRLTELAEKIGKLDPVVQNDIISPYADYVAVIEKARIESADTKSRNNKLVMFINGLTVNDTMRGFLSLGKQGGVGGDAILVATAVAYAAVDLDDGPVSVEDAIWNLAWHLPETVARCSGMETAVAGVQRAVRFLARGEREKDCGGYAAILLRGLCDAARHAGSPEHYLEACRMIPETDPEFWDEAFADDPFGLLSGFADTLRGAGQTYAAEVLLRSAAERSLLGLAVEPNPAALPSGVWEVLEQAGRLDAERRTAGNAPSLQVGTGEVSSRGVGSQSDRSTSVRSVRAETVLVRRFEVEPALRSAREYLNGIGATEERVTGRALDDFGWGIFCWQGARVMALEDLYARAVERLHSGVIRMFMAEAGCGGGMGRRWPQGTNPITAVAAAERKLGLAGASPEFLSRLKEAVWKLNDLRNRISHPARGLPSHDEVEECLGVWFGRGPGDGRTALLAEVCAVLERPEGSSR